MVAIRLATPWIFALSICSKDGPERVWVVFNGDDAVDIAITDVEVGAAITKDLTSSTGESVVGFVTIDPGSGPVGTDHRVVVQIDDAFEERVQRVEVEAVSGDRGTTLIDFEQDSADEGLWVADLTSHGGEDETRVDTLRFVLWELEEAPDEGN